MENIKKVLEISNLEKTYGALAVLKKINFYIKQGEYVVLLGPNGAGKSTLFSILTGIIAADSGKCEIYGSDISKKPVFALKRIGIVFQQPTIDMELTIKENLEFHLRLHGIKIVDHKEKIRKDVEKNLLLEKFNHKVRVLSGGERRKVELIRALLHNPKVLIMDEPTVGLDPKSRKDLINRILELKKIKKLSILWATHLVDEAEKADKIIVLNKGKIIKMGTPMKIMKDARAENLNQAFFNLTIGNENEN